MSAAQGGLIEVLLELIVEILGEVLFGIAGAIFEEAISDEGRARRLPAAVGHVLMGMMAGAISLMVLRHQVLGHLGIPGISLILAPVGTGTLLELLGRWWVNRGNVRVALFSFWGGFCFALGMAVVRYAYFERVWTWL